MQQQDNENLTSVRLEQYFLVLYRSKWSIFFILLLALLTAFIKNDVSQPVYQATAKLWVKQQDKSIGSSNFEDMFMSGMFGRTAELETLCEIIRSPSTIEMVIDDLELLDNPIPEHRGTFVAWISSLGPDILTSIPEMNTENYTAFRHVWAAIEASYLASHLESFTDPAIYATLPDQSSVLEQITPERIATLSSVWSTVPGTDLILTSAAEELKSYIKDADLTTSTLLGVHSIISKTVQRRAEELDSIRLRIEKLGQLDDTIAGVRGRLDTYLESLSLGEFPEANTLRDIIMPLNALKIPTESELHVKLASEIFQWRPWLDSLLTVSDHAKIRRQTKDDGIRAVYDRLIKTGQLVASQDALNMERPYDSLRNVPNRSRISFRDFQKYCMDPPFDYAEYQRLIQRILQDREIREAYETFQTENADHPDRSLWTERDFREHYRRVQHEELLEEIQSNLNVQPSRDADVIQITVKAPSQERAVSIANRLATRFEEFMVGDARSRMQVTKSFAKARKDEIDQELIEASERLSKYQAEQTTVALSVEAEATIRGLSELELLRAKAQGKEESAKQRIDQLMAQLQQEDPTIISSETFAQNEVQNSFRLKLKEAQIELERLRQKYPDGQSEEIKRQEAIINGWQEALASESPEQITRTQSPNPLVMALTESLVTAQQESIEANAELNVLESKIAQYNTRLLKMPETEQTLARLMREVKRYEALSETLAQAEQEAEMLEQAEPSNIVAFQPASAKQQLLPISPRRGMNLMLGGLIGLALGVGLAFLREYLDNTYGTVEEAQRDLEFISKRVNPSILPTFLTMVPAIDTVGSDRSYVITLKEPKSGAAEAFRIVRTKLQFMGTEAPVRCILVTSATPGEGKSTVSSNLAVALAQQMGKRVLLIDADLRKPVQHRIFADAMQSALALPQTPGNPQPQAASSQTDLIIPTAPRAYNRDSDTYGLSRLLVKWRDMMSSQGPDSPVHQWLLSRKHVPDGSNGSPILADEDEIAAYQEIGNLVQQFIRRVSLRVEASSHRHRNSNKQPQSRSIEQVVNAAESPSDVSDEKDMMVELDLIPSGPHPPNPSELLSSESMEQLLEYVRTTYDYIVIDSPPVKAAADPIILSSYVDTVIYTFDIVKTKRFDIRSALEELLEANPRNVGTLCNLTEVQHGGYYGYGGRYGYNKYGYYYGRYRYGDYYSYYYEEEKDDQVATPTEDES